MTSRPTLVPHARLRVDRRSNETLLLVPEQGFVLNDTALAIVRLCTGEHTIGKIIDQLAHQHGEISRHLVADDVLDFLHTLAHRGLIREKGEA